jgi:hypothetical protein
MRFIGTFASPKRGDKENLRDHYDTYYPIFSRAEIDYGSTRGNDPRH